MLPLIPLALSLAPSIAAWLFGPKGEATTAAVVSAAAAITGTADPAAQMRALEDPAQANAFAVELAKIAAAAAADQRAADNATLAAGLADVANARAQTVALAQVKSPMAWSAAVLSGIVLLTFGAMLGCVLAFPLPPGAGPLANVMLGTLAAMATQTVNYWLGSSAGSARKTEDLATASRQLANSVPVTGSRL